MSQGCEEGGYAVHVHVPRGGRGAWTRVRRDVHRGAVLDGQVSDGCVRRADFVAWPRWFLIGRPWVADVWRRLARAVNNARAKVDLPANGMLCALRMEMGVAGH